MKKNGIHPDNLYKNLKLLPKTETCLNYVHDPFGDYKCFICKQYECDHPYTINFHKISFTLKDLGNIVHKPLRIHHKIKENTDTNS